MSHQNRNKMAAFPSNFYVLFLFVLLLLIYSESCQAFRKMSARRRPAKTPAIETTTEQDVHQLKELGTDTYIYHSAKTNDKCECGAFKSPKKSSESPLYYQIAMQNFHCDEPTCKSMCLALPAFNENRGVEILCAHVNQAQGLRPAVHYKNCNDNWLYAGSHGTKNPICCEAGKVVTC